MAGEDTVLFLRTEAQATAYLPVQDDAARCWRAACGSGSIIGGEELTVPSDRLFYSGGGGSVRGYEYQGVGPRLPDNTPRGGLSLFETSVEVRHDIGESFGAVGLRRCRGRSASRRRPTSPTCATPPASAPATTCRSARSAPTSPSRWTSARATPSFQVYISIGQAF